MKAEADIRPVRANLATGEADEKCVHTGYIHILCIRT